jgi:hypothetical protein
VPAVNARYFGSRANFLGIGTGVVAAGAASLVLSAPQLPLVAVVAALGYAGGALLGLRPSRSELSAGEVFDRIPDDLRRQLQRLRANAANPTLATRPAVAARVTDILTNSQELFRRILRRGDSQQVRMAAVEYTDTLEKLNLALSDDYYFDIVKNPRLWDDADRRAADVESALAAVGEQLVKNIRQVNASQDLDLSVALDGLSRAMSTPTANDMINGTIRPDQISGPDTGGEADPDEGAHP